MTPLGRLWGVKHTTLPHRQKLHPCNPNPSKQARRNLAAPVQPHPIQAVGPPTNRPDPPVLAAPKPPAPEPNENPPTAGFAAAAGVLKLKPPAAAGAPKPPDAGAPKGLEVGVPKAGVEEAPKGEEPPKAGVLDAPKMPPPELGAPKPVLPNAGVDAAVRAGREEGPQQHVVRGQQQVVREQQHKARQQQQTARQQQHMARAQQR